ncbi:MAG: type III pantothenate kinase [Myxococcota bacterium]|jgi:type III pantothenate kinase
MLLALAVGNTHTVIGVARGDAIVATMRIRTEPRTTDELGLLLLRLLEQRGIDPEALTGAVVGSVAPAVLYTVEKACVRYLGVEPLVVGRNMKTGMRVRTDNPREIGADRIANAVAAVHLYGGPVVVVAFGTATTVDCIDQSGDYVGGAIAPGFRISEEALFTRTSQLPRVELSRPPSPIGRNTRHAIQSGLYWGYTGLVDRLAGRCRDALAPEARVVATGGMAALLAPDCETIDHVEPFLTLKGLIHLHTRNA